MTKQTITPHGRTRRLALMTGFFAGLFGAVRSAKAKECGCFPEPDCSAVCPNGGTPRADGTQACNCDPDPIKPRALALVDGGDAVNTAGFGGWFMRVRKSLSAKKVAVFGEAEKTLDYVGLDELKYVHPDSGVRPGTYIEVTVDRKGHVTDGASISPLTFYPVGSVYISFNPADPGTLFGGVWEAIRDGRALLAADDAHPAGSTGGEETHTLTAAEMPSHTHTGGTAYEGGHTHDRGSMNFVGHFEGYEMGRSDGFTSSGAFYLGGSSSYVGASSNHRSAPIVQFDASRGWSGETSSTGSHSHTMTLNNTGGSGKHNNMQPFVAAYMWHRIA